ncbi:sperm flagellar protein 1 isoform X2 [Capricornis sumatraensis]|uniref:sperm flagellar protein 1 isoform X2 n=1 Tax=Capricornis sumatraensis TaxID=34865 RepID=UPI003604D0EB
MKLLWRICLWLITVLGLLPPLHISFPFHTSTSSLGPTTLPPLILPPHPFLLPLPSSLPISTPSMSALTSSLSVLVAEVIKFYFPKMVEMHNYVPANSLQQKLSNWSHLNRKVLNKLNFSVPEDVMRKIAQCAPGVVELVLIPLRQRLEERQRRRKQGIGSLQLAPQDGTDYIDVGLSQKARGEGVPEPQGRGQLREGRLPVPRPPGDSQALQSDPSFVLQIAEKEQELLASQETVQVLQMKVRRLEHLLQLKNVRIEDLSRRLQQAERKQR